MSSEILRPSGESIDKNLHGDGDLKKEVQKTLFSSWFTSAVLNGTKRNRYKVPFKIQLLPCGCCRERTSESDPNNTWFIKRKGTTYSHSECKKEISQ